MGTKNNARANYRITLDKTLVRDLRKIAADKTVAESRPVLWTTVLREIARAAVDKAAEGGAK